MLTAKQPNVAKALATSTDLPAAGTAEVAEGLRNLLADVFAIYVKTKNFHWHMSGPHFRDYHLLLDDQSEQIFAMTDDVAERARKIGETTVRSIGEIARRQRVKDNDENFVSPQAMLARARQRQSRTGERTPFATRRLRRSRRRRHRQPHRELDRRDGTPDVVPLRSGAKRLAIKRAGLVFGRHWHPEIKGLRPCCDSAVRNSETESHINVLALSGLDLLFWPSHPGLRPGLS